MSTIYALDPEYFQQLLDDRQELFAVARSLKSAEAMREARADLMANTDINITPKNSEELKKSYAVDSEGVAHIPIVGELTPKAQKNACGAYTAQALTEYGFIIDVTAAAEKDDRVKSISYFIDSPGGSVNGVFEAANAMRMVSKPTEAIVSGRSASAAYLLASQADKIIGTSVGARFGSIGVVAEFRDDTKALENMGITRHVFTSTDAPEKRPDLSTKEGAKSIITQLDDLHGLFVNYVAEGRKTTAENVNKNFGRGGMLIAEKALKAGMIDEVRTYSRNDVVDVVDESAGVASDNTAAKAESQEVNKMTNLEELKKEAPALYAEAVQIGEKQGIEKERARQARLDEQLEADPGNPKLAEVIAKAKAEGKELADVQTQIVVAVRDGKLSGENPLDVETAEVLKPLDEVDRKAMKAAGITDEKEYRELLAYAEKEGI